MSTPYEPGIRAMLSDATAVPVANPNQEPLAPLVSQLKSQYKALAPARLLEAARDMGHHDAMIALVHDWAKADPETARTVGPRIDVLVREQTAIALILEVLRPQRLGDKVRHEQAYIDSGRPDYGVDLTLSTEDLGKLHRAVCLLEPWNG